MLQKMTEEEIEFMEFFHDPVCMTENLIPKNIDAPQTWDENCDCINVRLYQLPFLSYEYMIAIDPKLNENENARLRQGAGNVYNIGGRKFGKSFITIDTDAPLSVIHNSGQITCVASFDRKHLARRMERICNYIELHPFFRLYHIHGQKKTVRRGDYRIETNNGHILIGVNESIQGKNPGKDFHQEHWDKFYYEEHSYESIKGHEKRVDSTSELGAIERTVGIPEITKGSPLGDVLRDSSKRNWTIRLPQLVNPYFDEETRKLKIKEYNGEGSIGFKLNVLGEELQGSYSRFDMERVKKCIDEEKEVLYTEINKDNFHKFKDIINISKISSQKTFICSDIGDMSTPSEIIVIFKNGDKFLYRYNITLNKLTDEEQEKIIFYIYSRLDGGYIGLDTTDGTGRAIYRRLIKKLNTKIVFAINFNSNVPIDFEKDDKKRVQRDRKGNPILKTENTLEWANNRLEKFLYGKKFIIPLDNKFEKEFGSYIRVVRGGRKIHGSTATDHLLQAFQVFAIVQWMIEFSPVKSHGKKLSLGA